MSETVLNSAYEIVQHGGFTEKDLDAFTRFVLVLGIGHTPIVRCGDSNVVLAVDREELEADVTDGVEVHFDEVGNITHVTYDAHAIVAAILAKLDLREVEEVGYAVAIEDAHDPLFVGKVIARGAVAALDANGVWTELSGREVATLKPSPTSKEG